MKIDKIGLMLAADVLSRQVEAVRSAYNAAMSALENQKILLNEEVREYAAKVDAGVKEWEIPVGPGQWHNVSEHLSVIAEEIDSEIIIVRHAFVIALYHSWEKHRQEYFDKSDQKRLNDAEKDKHAISVLQQSGGMPDARALEILRLTANVAKHSNGPSSSALQNMRPASYVITSGTDLSKLGAKELNITADDMEEFFTAMHTFYPDPFS